MEDQGLVGAMVQLVGELAVDPLARRLMLLHTEDTSPLTARALLCNVTLKPVLAAIDRCACGWSWMSIVAFNESTHT